MSDEPQTPSLEQQVASLLATVDALAKQLVLLKTQVLRQSMTTDGIINLLANAQPK